MEYGFYPTSVRSVNLFRGKMDVTLCLIPNLSPSNEGSQDCARLPSGCGRGPLVLVAHGPETDSNEERYCVLCVSYT